MKPVLDDVEVLAMLYNPAPGSGLPAVKIVRTTSPVPLPPQQLFLRGDPAALAKLLRSDEPLAADVRAFVANIVDGSVKRPRGNKRMRGLSVRDVGMIRELAASAKEKKIKAKDIESALATFYKRSEASIRDVIGRQHTYAEK